MSPTDQIVAIYEEADESMREQGRGWYAAAREACERMGRGVLPVEAVARAVAALSPRCAWQTNLAFAEAVVDSHFAGSAAPPVSTIANRTKARHELAGVSALSGPKTTTFARAILGDDDAVTIDSWILRAVGLSPTAKVTPHRERWITAAFREAAAIVGETPRDLQAIVWCAIRGRSD